ncbi:50S ribosomal L9 C-terminal domain-containing protein [Shigella flexneri]
MASKAGDEGKLFGSIGTRDIADELLQLALKLCQERSSPAERRFAVLLANTKWTSRFTAEVFAKVIINVVAE